MTLVETVMACALIAITFLSFSTVIMQSSRINAIDREKTQIYNACRDLVEQLRADDFDTVMARYNADPADDPGSAGSAPGRHFSLPVQNLAGTAALVEISFPMPTLPGPEGTSNQGLNLDHGGPGSAGSSSTAVIDNSLAQALGLQDSNGDGEVDALTGPQIGSVLPVRISLAWRGVTGNARLEFTTLLRKS